VRRKYTLVREPLLDEGEPLIEPVRPKIQSENLCWTRESRLSSRYVEKYSQVPRTSVGRGRAAYKGSISGARAPSRGSWNLRKYSLESRLEKYSLITQLSMNELSTNVRLRNSPICLDTATIVCARNQSTRDVRKLRTDMVQLCERRYREDRHAFRDFFNDSDRAFLSVLEGGKLEQRKTSNINLHLLPGSCPLSSPSFT